MRSVSWVVGQKYGGAKRGEMPVAFPRRVSLLFFRAPFSCCVLELTKRLDDVNFFVTLPLILIRFLLNTSDIFYGDSSVSFCIFAF